MHILSPFFSCVCTPDEFDHTLALGYKEIYIRNRSSIVKHHQLRGTDRFVRVKVNSIPNYIIPYEIEIAEEIKFLPAGKIPIALLDQVIAFFKKVMEVKKAELEAMIHILWNPEQGYHLGVPPQTISKAAVSYGWDYIPAGTSIIVDIHSHNTMGAFFSSTDNRDDFNNISFSGVVGKINDPEPMTVWRFNYFDKKINVNLSDIFEVPVKDAIEIPKEWMDQVKIPAPSPMLPTVVGSNWGRLDRQSRLGGNAEFPFPKGGLGRISKESDFGIESLGLDFEGDFSRPDAVWRGSAKKTSTKTKKDKSLPPAPSLTPISKEDPIAGKLWEKSLNSLLNLNEGDLNSNDSDSLDLLGLTDEIIEYEIMIDTHGADVADAWHDVYHAIPMLQGKDDVVSELVSGLFEATSGEGQLSLFKTLYSQLSPKDQSNISTFGI